MRIARWGVVGCLALAACGHGGAGALSPGRFEADPGWLVVRHVPVVRQTSETNCGAAALASVLNYWERSTTVADVTAAYPPDPQRGIFAGHLRDFARNRGLSAFLIAGTPADLNAEIALGRPVLVGLVKDQDHKVFGHYAVVVGLRRDGGSILIMDPAEGWRDQPLNTFLAEWGRAQQVTLVLSPVAPEATRQRSFTGSPSAAALFRIQADPPSH